MDDDFGKVNQTAKNLVKEFLVISDSNETYHVLNEVDLLLFR